MGVSICFLAVDFEELGKPGLRSQLCHLLALCLWVNYLKSELRVFTCDIDIVPYFKVFVCGFVEITYGNGLASCLHVVTFN